MTNVSYLEWANVIFFFGLMCAYSFFFGDLAAQVLLRLKSRGKISSYNKWGVYKELFRPNSVVWLIVQSVLAVISVFFTFYMAFLTTVLVTESSTSALDRFQYTLIFAMNAAYIGFAIESQRIKNITDKTSALDNLRDVFHQRFSPSELLSMYEAMRLTPPLFWEEYASLSAHQISESTNSIFRERAAPYGHSQSSKYNRIVIVVAVLTLLTTVTIAIKELVP